MHSHGHGLLHLFTQFYLLSVVSFVYRVVLVNQKKKLINAAFVYPLYAENKDSSHNGKSTKNNVRQPGVYRQVF